jgi:hypothetical protein
MRLTRALADVQAREGLGAGADARGASKAIQDGCGRRVVQWTALGGLRRSFHTLTLATDLIFAPESVIARIEAMRI